MASRVAHRRKRLAIIGAGRAGSALAVLLAGRGWKIAAVASSRPGPARSLARRCGATLATDDPVRAARSADAILVAVQDRSIPGIVELLGSADRQSRKGAPGSRPAPSVSRMTSLTAAASLGESGRSAREPRGRAPDRLRIALHTSGSTGAEILSPLRENGWAVGSFHPLIAFPPVSNEGRAGSLGRVAAARSQILSLEGATIAIDGDAPARRLARELVTSLHAAALELPASRRIEYHLAACFASNYVVTLAAEAAALLGISGVGRKRALQALLPLMRSTLRNLEEVGIPAALTGPVARGDDVTIRRHVALLRRAPAALRDLHTHLVRRTLRLALSAGRLDAAAVRRIERALGGSSS